MPQPFIGDLRAAKVFVLVLNPGLRPIDYFAELRVPDYREALKRNLRQEFDREFPNLWFDPRFAWHSGFAYWNRRFAPIIDSLTEEIRDRRRLLSFLSRSVAILQLVPYHSAKFGLLDSLKLRSTALAVDFVSEELAPRARRKELLLVVGRKPERWKLKKTPTLKYHPRGAYFTEKTQRQLLKFLRGLLERELLH